ncbi:type V CRISPR-associated protein Cas4 [uncultured Eubacterium sp.]|uniref:type V CRISPR-associated protein Cas4 n=1 Tax=Eubacterium sp. TaxID=142586 RepID=UPI0026717EF7|nr:type V CRISPR-associated protein Cas4 [uncultured Eubacterium sp.]
MEDLIKITNINDFIFCPISIYFHNLYDSQSVLTFQSDKQLNGTKAHETVDNNNYSSRKNIITSLEVYSEEYCVVGKIDLYDADKKMLVERKKHITEIYDGYIFQLYAQYYCMTEMGYDVLRLEIQSIDDNKRYKIKLPGDDIHMKEKFEQTIESMRTFDIETFVQNNSEKCRNCIYNDACDRALDRNNIC